MKNRVEKLIIIMVIVVCMFSLCACGDAEEPSKDSEIISKLQKFTTMNEEEGAYVFESDGMWSLYYTTENEFAKFHQEWIQDCFSNWFGDTELGNDGTFKYDLDENKIRIYFHYESDEGVLSIISYNIDDDEFTANFDGDRYEVTDEFAEYIKEYGLIEILQNNIDEMKSDLEKYGLSIDEIKKLNYENIADSVS